MTGAAEPELTNRCRANPPKQCFWGLYFAFYYLASFSRDVIGLSYTESLNLLLVLNGVGAIGRIVPNFIADRHGPITTFVPAAAAAGICVLAWGAVRSPAGLYAWACCYGMAAGGVQSLFPAGLSSLTADLRRTGVRMGMVFSVVSFATLTGPPIQGALVAARGYGAAFVFAGVVLLAGAAFMAAARGVRMRRDGAGWAVKV
jgi:predicted MFS family arabinose efflux permease